jgi:hypothetical protein
MLRLMLPALCIPQSPPPVENWTIAGIVWAALLFAEVPALFLLLRSVQPAWRWRTLASVPLLAGIWCLLLDAWAQANPRTFLFLCQQFPGQPSGGLIETSPPLVKAQGGIEAVTVVLVFIIIVGGLSLAMIQRRKVVAL